MAKDQKLVDVWRKEAKALRTHMTNLIVACRVAIAEDGKA